METQRSQLSVQLLVILAAVFVVFLLIGGAAGAEELPGPTVEYVVSSGDTLWEIAAEHVGPQEDLRAFIRQIKEVSGIESSTIIPGQILNIPLG